MRRCYLATPAVMALALLLIGCTWRRSTKSNSPQPPPSELAQVGQLAPEIDGEDTQGQPLRLSDYRGKVVVLHFWANW
jgi:hypothetical protein